jgi:uncharacterized repeat protein (TIGR01451 family)
LFYADLEDMIANDDATRLSLAACHELQVVYDSPDDNPDQGATNRRLFDIVADEYARKGGDAGTSVLPGSATVTSGNDPDGVPYGGGRADVRVALGGDGEIYILSKSDGMVRKLVAVVKPPPNTAPVVNAGADRVVPTHSTTLSGSARDDGLPNPPGTLVYSWTKLSGPGSVTFGNANAANSTADFSSGGVYVLQLSASDGALAGTDTVALTVNKAPSVNAGADQAITLPDAVGLSGFASDDGIPGPAISTTWSKASGPGTVTFGDVHALTTTASFSNPGTYSLTLSASDTVFTHSDSMTVTANPAGTTPSADVKVTITDGKTVVTAGTKTTYTITVTNIGPYAVTGTTVKDTFPAIYTGTTFTATQTGGASGFTASGAGNVNDTLTMPVASKVTYVVVGKVSSAATGNLSNTVTAVVPNGVTDPVPANNSTTDTDTLQLKADGKVTNTDGKTTAIPGQKNTYTIVVTNLGPSDARGAVVQDSFPSFFTGVSFTATATGGATGFHAGGTGNINDTVTLPSGSKITYKATGTISASAVGSMTNTASVTPPSGVTDPVSTNNSATDTDSL